MSATEVFENHGLTFTDVNQAAAGLAGLSVDDLWNVMDDFLVDQLEVQGSEKAQSIALRYALLDAFREGRESITQNDFNLAQEKAFELTQDEPDAAEAPTAEATTAEADAAADATLAASETEAKPSKKTRSKKATGKTKQTATTGTKPVLKKKSTRKRTSPARAYVRKLVQDNPEADAETIVGMAQENEKANIAETTLTSYFYTERRALGLAGTGRRGRKPNDTLQQCKQVILDNWDSERNDIIKLINEQVGIELSTSMVYYHKALKEIESEYEISE